MNDPAPHAIRTLFPDYATRTALGQNAAAVYPAVVEHVRTCAECHAVLDELLDLVDAAYTEDIPPAPEPPAPNLSFLQAARPPTVPAHTWVTDPSSRLTLSFSPALLDSIRHARPAFRARGGELLYRYRPAHVSASALSLQVDVFAQDIAQDFVSLRIGVASPQRDATDQIGTEVRLSVGTQSWQSTTDEVGMVHFNDIPHNLLPDLRIEITSTA